MTTVSPRLACSGVTVQFGGLTALLDVDLDVPAATTVGLVGPNGAGKSTLFGVVSGLIRPARGRILLDGEDVTDRSPQQRARRGLARTFQHPELFAGLTVREHLVIAYRAKYARRRVWSDLFTMGSLHRENTQEQEHVDELIELLGLTSLSQRTAVGLPLGAARQLELGRALAASPTILLLDEPSSGLDAADTEHFETTLGRMARERGVSVLLVEHDVELVMRMCSTIYVLDFGSLIASGSPTDVRSDPAVRAAYLGEGSTDTGGTGGGGIDGAGPASKVGVAARTSSGPDRSTLLTVEGLCVHYGDATAVSDVSFGIHAGSVLAVLGANGAGKSSLARVLCGLVPLSGGRMVLDGEDISRWSPHRIRRAGVVSLPEGRGVFRDLTVIENLRMAAAALEGRQARREAVDRALELFPILAERRKQLAGRLSGGEQQMLSLVRALATSPKLLIADELSLGLAPTVVDVVFDGLDRARQAGVTVIMTEQYVHRALAFADECLVLQRGELAWAGPVALAEAEVFRHYLGDGMAVAT
jgi:branched-chain amino acid transport system ATP-binding protein